jgi:hypothetical protein
MTNPAHRLSMNPKDKEKAHSDIPPSVSDLHCKLPSLRHPQQTNNDPNPCSLYVGFTETNGVITTTMFDVPGYRVVRVLGAVYGLTVRSRNWAASMGMVLKSIAGGELQWFTNMVCSFSLPVLFGWAG